MNMKWNTINELSYYFTYLSIVLPTNISVFLVGLSLLIQHFQQILWVFLLEETSTPTRPVENVVLTTKGLQERNINVEWDEMEK